MREFWSIRNNADQPPVIGVQTQRRDRLARLRASRENPTPPDRPSDAPDWEMRCVMPTIPGMLTGLVGLVKMRASRFAFPAMSVPALHRLRKGTEGWCFHPL